MTPIHLDLASNTNSPSLLLNKRVAGMFLPCRLSVVVCLETLNIELFPEFKIKGKNIKKQKFLANVCLFSRLFQSILNLHQVLQSSAHWVLLLDKSQYHHDQSKPFLQMVTFNFPLDFIYLWRMFLMLSSFNVIYIQVHVFILGGAA